MDFFLKLFFFFIIVFLRSPEIDGETFTGVIAFLSHISAEREKKMFFLFVPRQQWLSLSLSFAGVCGARCAYYHSQNTPASQLKPFSSVHFRCQHCEQQQNLFFFASSIFGTNEARNWRAACGKILIEMVIFISSRSRNAYNVRARERQQRSSHSDI